MSSLVTSITIVIVKVVNHSHGKKSKFRFVINITKYDRWNIENMHNIYVLHINVLYAVLFGKYTVYTYLILFGCTFFNMSDM